MTSAVASPARRKVTLHVLAGRLELSLTEEDIAGLRTAAASRWEGDGPSLFEIASGNGSTAWVNLARVDVIEVAD